MNTCTYLRISEDKKDYEYDYEEDWHSILYYV